MAVVRLSEEFNDLDTTVGANEYSPGGGNTTALDTTTGRQLQGAGCVTFQVDNETLIQAAGKADGGSINGTFGLLVGSTSWSLLSSVNVLGYNGTSEFTRNIPSSYFPTLSGYVPVWVNFVQPGDQLQAIGLSVTAGNVPNNSGNNMFFDNITYYPSGANGVYALNGTSSLSALAAAEANSSTGFNQCVILSNGTYFFYAGIVIGETTGGTASQFNFSETGANISIIEPGAMTAQTSFADLLEWNINLNTASSTFAMTNCNYSASETENRNVPTRILFSGSSASTSAKFLNCNLLDIDLIQLTPACTIEGGTTRAVSITQSSAHIFDGTVVTQATNVNVATILNTSFGTNSGIHDTLFIQGGTGPALDVTSSTTFTNIKFSGYSGLNGEPVINSSSNNVVITRDANTPDFNVRQVGLGGNITTQGPDRNFQLTGLKDGTEVRLINAATKSSIAGVDLIAQGTAFTRAPVTVSGSQDNNTFNYAYQYSSDINIDVAIIHPDEYEILYLSSTLQDSDKSIPVQQQIDRNWADPVTNSSTVVVKSLSSFYLTGRGTESSPFQGFSLTAGQDLAQATATFSAVVACNVNIQASIDNPDTAPGNDVGRCFIDGALQNNVWQSGSVTLLEEVTSKSATLSLTAGQTFAIQYAKDIDVNPAGDIDILLADRIVFTPT